MLVVLSVLLGVAFFCDLVLAGWLLAGDSEREKQIKELKQEVEFQREVKQTWRESYEQKAVELAFACKDVHELLVLCGIAKDTKEAYAIREWREHPQPAKLTWKQAAKQYRNSRRK